MTSSINHRLELHSSNAEKSEALRERLRQQYGIYGVRLVEVESAIDAESIQLRYGDEQVAYDDTAAFQLSEFITGKMSLSHEQLSCRDDSDTLERYWMPDNRLDIYQDPRDWIKTNPMIAELIAAQPSFGNVIDFLCEQRGLFIKPPHYKLQGTYWNSTSNGGLPIVRKKDAIHEGTFMLHDLFHMVVQDPLPFADDSEPLNFIARGNFLSHRMASEAMTMVLADMHGVHTVGLDEKGYDTSKRKIYPVYREILSNKGDIDVYDVVSANIDFCFTGETDSLTSLGASSATVGSFTEKYDTFFSADYDWNDHNFLACNTRAQQDPEVAQYYALAKKVFGLPMINDIYDGRATKDDIITSFIEQLTDAQNYRANNNEMLRMKEVARRFYGGQLALFYSEKLPRLRSSVELERYIELSTALMDASSPEEIREISAMLDELIDMCISEAEDAQELDPQSAALYRMHVPLYPAFFINYQLERERIVPLQRKVALLEHSLS